MQVVEVFSGGSDEEATQSAFRPWDSPDFDGQMSVLSWKVWPFTANFLKMPLFHRWDNPFGLFSAAQDFLW
jgi:hypothetical protein